MGLREMFLKVIGIKDTSPKDSDRLLKDTSPKDSDRLLKDTSPKDSDRLLKEALEKNLSALKHLNLKLDSVHGIASNAVRNFHMLDQKFEALTERLGITIVADCVRNPQKAYVVRVKDKSAFNPASKYINSTITAEKLLALHRKMVTQCTQLMKDIDWR